MYRSIAISFLIVFCCACHDEVKEATAPHGIRLAIEWYGDSGLVETSAMATIIANNFTWSEGPVWVDKTNTLLVSDVPGNIIYQWSREKGQQVYLKHAGFADTLDHRGSDGSNGLAIDQQGQLIICQSGARRVVRMKAAVDAPVAEYEVIAENYNGKKFNSPNDVVVDRNNAIYFTDPVYGLPGKDKDPARELNYEGVFRISSHGIVALLIDSIPKPNGITLSPDEKILYISSSDEKKPGWYAYQLSDSGTIISGAMILDALPLREKALVKQSPDGLKTDNEGTIFSTGPEGVSIISPEGKLLGLIKVKDRSTSNCAFNTKKDSLYITADDIVLQIEVNGVLKGGRKKP